MRIGVTMFPTEYAIDVPTLAQECEARGFESLFVPEHTHIPASRRTPWPGGAELPKEYSHTLDPFVALGAAAAVTERLLLGTGICLVIERDPITLAKEVATVDHISKGRFLFGIGGGWNREEMENHGTDPRRRWDVLRERIEAMKAIWSSDEAEYHGTYVDFEPVWSWPKPVQRPHPPILVGGSGPTTFDRIMDYGDEWMPIHGRGQASLPDQIIALQKRAVDHGRPPVPVSLFAAPPRRDDLERLEATGVSRAVFFLPPAEREVVLPLLDKYAGLA